MLSLYEILKASKTGIAPDMWTALAGANWSGAGSGAETKELTGIPPLSFTANGQPLLDYLISGNMSQTGTPTPTTPIQPSETGEKTAQLWDGTYKNNWGVDVSNRRVYITSNRFAITIPVDSYTDYTISRSEVGGSTYFVYGLSSELPNDNTVFEYCDRFDYDALSQTVNSQECHYLTIFFGATLSPDIIVNIGNTALPYEPYGYKLDISSANTTTPVYLGEVESTRRIKKLVLTGEETSYMAIDTSKNIFSIRGVFNQAPELLQVGGFCTHYKYNNAISSLAQNMSNGDFVLNKIADDFSFTIRDNSFSNDTDFKQYVQQQYSAGTPVCVWYVLAEPETGILNEPLRKIGDYADTVSYEQAGVQIPTNRGNTVIDVLTELKPSEMYIKYQK